MCGNYTMEDGIYTAGFLVVDYLVSTGLMKSNHQSQDLNGLEHFVVVVYWIRFFVEVKRIIC